MPSFEPYPFTATQHPATLPPLTDGADRERHPVVIVGGGLVGLATALGLARQGVRSLVLEADAGVCTGSRAICLSRRTLEILARWGAVRAFLDKGLPWSGGRSFYREAEVLRFTMPGDVAQTLPPMINLQQYYIEQFLLDACEATGLVEVRWQTRLESLAADGAPCAPDDRAGDCLLEVSAGGVSYRLRAAWVIGCDGARSRVRELVGLKLEGTSYEGRYVIADVRLRSARPTERLAWFDPPSNPGSTLLMHRQPDDVWRIDYQLRDDADPQAAIAPEQVLPRIDSHLRMIGERADWSPIWISLYRANALTLPTYRCARVLLAGDAAHLVPIFGVRGANSAVEDADNLSWKLGCVLQGRADAALLDSYSAERVAAARANLREGMKSTEFMSPPSPAFSLMRTAVLSLAREHHAVRSLINPRQTRPASYVDSPLRGPDAGGWQGGAAPGALAPGAPRAARSPGTQSSGGDLRGAAFTLLHFAGASASADAEIGRRLAQAAGVPVRVQRLPADAEAASHFGARPGATCLLRPDDYVLARWGELDLDAVSRCLRSALRSGKPDPARAP